VRDRAQTDRPDWSGISSMAKDLRSAISNAEQAQRKALTVTGVAWSKDGLVKAVVGPRGHLLELEIDPRVYRTPNSKSLSATIVATVRAATDDAMLQTGQILDESVPADLRSRSTNRLDMWRMSRMNDADLREEILQKDEDDGLG
jgi:DNA-binding protein YbaB